jgi:Methyltransferase domain
MTSQFNNAMLPVHDKQLVLKNALRISGFMHPLELEMMAEKATRAVAIAELGSYMGRTTRAMAENTKGIVYAVDTWEGSPELMTEVDLWIHYFEDPDILFHEFQRNTADLKNIITVRGKTHDVVNRFADESLDLILIDAAHDYSSVVEDIQDWWPKLKIGGDMVGHDFQDTEVIAATMNCFPGMRPPPPEIARAVFTVTKEPKVENSIPK